MQWPLTFIPFSCQLTKIGPKLDNDSDADDDDDDTKALRANIPQALYTGTDHCKADRNRYHLNGWSFAGAQRIQALTSLVVKNRMAYNTSFNSRMRKFVDLKQLEHANQSKKRKRPLCPGNVLTIQSDLDLDPAAMFPEHNAHDYANENNELMQLDDGAIEYE